MSEDIKIKKIALKTVGSNPDRWIEDIGRELEIGRRGCYKYLQEFVENAVMNQIFRAKYCYFIIKAWMYFSILN
jgi:hypothetical protein